MVHTICFALIRPSFATISHDFEGHKHHVNFLRIQTHTTTHTDDIARTDSNQSASLHFRGGL
jgi:hypothetical protein